MARRAVWTYWPDEEAERPQLPPVPPRELGTQLCLFPYLPRPTLDPRAPLPLREFEELPEDLFGVYYCG